MLTYHLILLSKPGQPRLRRKTQGTRHKIQGATSLPSAGTQDANIIQIYARMQMLCIKKCTREVKRGRGEWENSRLT